MTLSYKGFAAQGLLRTSPHEGFTLYRTSAFKIYHTRVLHFKFLPHKGFFKFHHTRFLHFKFYHIWVLHFTTQGFSNFTIQWLYILNFTTQGFSNFITQGFSNFTTQGFFKFHHTRVLHFKFYHTRVLKTFSLVLHLVASWLSFKRVKRDLFESLIYLNYLLSPWRSFWSFYRVQDSVFLFQMRRRHMLDAICECYAMHDFARKKMSMHKFISFILSLLGLPLSHPCTLYGSIILAFPFFFRKRFYLDTCQSCRISFSTLENKHPSCSIL